MSQKTLPLLFINLGGEMVYILDQRLRAQNIPDEKAKKVLHDIVSTMFHKRFVEELFKPQPLYSKKALRTVFDRLAHASIMRLNAASMDKTILHSVFSIQEGSEKHRIFSDNLYDLMTMAFKYQVSLALCPKDILLITLNHMDAIRKFVDGQTNILQQVEHVYRLLLESFGPMTSGGFHLIRQTLLNFFQDMHIRVSIFLKDKVQTSAGRFVLPTGGPLPWGTQVPGTIKNYDEKGRESKSASFPAGGNYHQLAKPGSIDIKGDRVTKLGTNMYSVARPVDTQTLDKPKTTPMSDIENQAPDPLAKAQLDLLSHLIGNTTTTEKSGFRLNLFSSDKEEEQAAVLYKPVETKESQVVKIDASKKQKNKELEQIMGELDVKDSGASGGEDLLDLMDSAS
ncbi:protein OSCP1-like isoform X1 [Ruditapes philippinarum]|uniref:protein OSCP1-like isoform X1 n=1 Tax=Ruditapes philippinarum TaxID=129788 RepID=UPI00295A8B67|nr:protein OSCP1-like isoform X1 [Ruditapes philippinarum]